MLSICNLLGVHLLSLCLCICICSAPAPESIYCPHLGLLIIFSTPAQHLSRFLNASVHLGVSFASPSALHLLSISVTMYSLSEPSHYPSNTLDSVLQAPVSPASTSPPSAQPVQVLHRQNGLPVSLRHFSREESSYLLSSKHQTCAFS